MNLSIGSKVYHVDYNKNEIVDFEIIGIITRKSSVEYIINDLYKWYENHSYDCYDDDDSDSGDIDNLIKQVKHIMIKENVLNLN